MDCFIVGQFRKRNTRAYEFQKGPANQKSFGCIAATHKNLSGKDAAATKMAAKGTCVMALMTGEQYVESMRKLNLQVYMFGKKIENPVDDPILRPSLNSVKATYDLAQDPEYADLMTAKSILTGETINRFTHIHQSTDDLIKKVKMQRPQPVSSAVSAWTRSTPFTAQPMRQMKSTEHITMRTSRNSSSTFRSMTIPLTAL